jgi:hypothetical protein
MSFCFSFRLFHMLMSLFRYAFSALSECSCAGLLFTASCSRGVLFLFSGFGEATAADATCSRRSTSLGDSQLQTCPQLQTRPPARAMLPLHPQMAGTLNALLPPISLLVLPRQLLLQIQNVCCLLHLATRRFFLILKMLLLSMATMRPLLCSMHPLFLELTQRWSQTL